MKIKRLWAVLLACMLTLSYAIVPVCAADIPEDSTPILRVSGRIDQSISANSIVAMEDSFSLEEGDVVSFNCTYTPKSANMNFGVIAPDGKFHFLSCTSGSINKSFTVGQSGQYTIAIRNNENYAVTVKGTIKY